MRRPLFIDILLAGAALLIPGVSAAEQLMNMPPEMRLMRAQPDTGELATDAVASPVTPDQLPERIQEELKANILRFTGDPAQIANVTIYAWNSPWLSAQGRPPNILVSYLPIQPAMKAGSADDRAGCDDEGCEVVGYMFNDDHWQQDFELRARAISFVRQPLSDPNHYTLQITTLSTPGTCPQDGSQSKTGCLRRFAWRNFGLAVLPPS